MLGHDPYYHHMTRKYIISFAKIFNDVKIQRFDSSGVAQKTIKVPITYAGKQKIFYYLNRRSETGIINQILPRMSFIITDAKYDPERKTNNMNMIPVSSDGTTENLMYSGVPYNFDITMSLWGKNMDDVLQIFEQVAPFFTPDYTITLNEIPELNINRNVPITLLDIGFDTSEDLDQNSDRNIFADLSFTLSGYLYPPITDSKIIRMIDINFKDFDTMKQLSTIHIDETNAVDSNFAFTYNSQYIPTYF